MYGDKANTTHHYFFCFKKQTLQLNKNIWTLELSDCCGRKLRKMFTFHCPPSQETFPILEFLLDPFPLPLCPQSFLVNLSKHFLRQSHPTPLAVPLILAVWTLPHPITKFTHLSILQRRIIRLITLWKKREWNHKHKPLSTNPRFPGNSINSSSRKNFALFSVSDQPLSCSSWESAMLELSQRFHHWVFV